MYTGEELPIIQCHLVGQLLGGQHLQGVAGPTGWALLLWERGLHHEDRKFRQVCIWDPEWSSYVHGLFLFSAADR